MDNLMGSAMDPRESLIADIRGDNSVPKYVLENREFDASIGGSGNVANRDWEKHLKMRISAKVSIRVNLWIPCLKYLCIF